MRPPIVAVIRCPHFLTSTKRPPSFKNDVLLVVWKMSEGLKLFEILFIKIREPATFDSHRPWGHKKNTTEKAVYSSDFFQIRSHSTTSQQLNIGLNSFLKINNNNKITHSPRTWNGIFEGKIKCGLVLCFERTPERNNYCNFIGFKLDSWQLVLRKYVYEESNMEWMKDFFGTIDYSF